MMHASRMMQLAPLTIMHASRRMMRCLRQHFKFVRQDASTALSPAPTHRKMGDSKMESPGKYIGSVEGAGR